MYHAMLCCTMPYHTILHHTILDGCFGPSRHPVVLPCRQLQERSEPRGSETYLSLEDWVPIKLGTHCSFLIRGQRGHPGVVLPLVISNSANR